MKNSKAKLQTNDRFHALTIIMQLFEHHRQLGGLIDASKPPCSPLTKALCYGLCRYYFRLERLADSLVNKRPKEKDLWLLLLLGLYQLQYLNKPEYATVQETVDLAITLKKPWAKGLINAVLRRFCREKDSILARLNQDRAYQLNHPQWFIQRLQQDWPQQWERILQQNDEHPPMSLRVNAQQSSAEKYLEQLTAVGISAERLPYLSQGIRLNTPQEVLDLPGFAAGQVSVQDAAAQLAVSLLDLKPGLRVLDMCAAPGGKTCQILETVADLDLTAVDIEEHRLQRVMDNLKRLRLQAKVILGDGLNPDSWWDKQPFDRILLDAPCSATGVIRRHPDIKHLRSEAEVQASQQLQAKLLSSIWPLLKTGGMMVYATCSVLKAENELQIADFVSRTPDCTVIKDEKPWGHNQGYGWQLFPGEPHNDGFFYSVLIRN